MRYRPLGNVPEETQAGRSVAAFPEYLADQRDHSRRHLELDHRGSTSLIPQSSYLFGEGPLAPLVEHCTGNTEIPARHGVISADLVLIKDAGPRLDFLAADRDAGWVPAIGFLCGTRLI